MLQLDFGLHAILQDLASLASSFYPLNSYFDTYTCKQKHACNIIVQCSLSSFKTQNRELNIIHIYHPPSSLKQNWDKNKTRVILIVDGEWKLNIEERGYLGLAAYGSF